MMTSHKKFNTLKNKSQETSKVSKKEFFLSEQWRLIVKQYVEAYRKAGFCVIPLAENSKVPQKGLDLEAIYDGKEVAVFFPKNANVGIITGRSKLFVIDCDSKEIATWFESRENYKDTAKTLTKRGSHYYYLISADDSLLLKPMSFKELGIDVKTGRSYVVAPPSVVDGYVYKWDKLSEGKILPPISFLSSEEVKEIIEELEELNEFLKSRKKIGRPRKLEENVQRVVEIFSKYYVEGQRQDLILALAGIAKKEGIAKETVFEIVDRLYQGNGRDDSLVQRYSAVENTFRKNPESVAGWSILERIVTEEDLKELRVLLGKIEKKATKVTLTLEEARKEAIKEIVTEGRIFVLRKKEDVPSWYYVKELRDESVTLVFVSPYFEVVKKYVVNYDDVEEGKKGKRGKVFHVIRTLAGDFLYDEPDKPLKIVKYLGAYVKHMDLFKDLFNKMANQLPFINLYNRTGWLEKNVFLHPCISYENENFEIDIKNYNDWFIIQDKEKHHEFVKKVLEEGKLLGVKMVFSVASLFTERKNGFVVIDVGERGVGKTLTSKLAVNLFYDSRTPHTTHNTLVAMELIMKQFKNLPVLFDEVALSYDEKIQALVFMVSSGKGKARGTPELTVRLSEIQNVLFLTTEREIEFDRLGVYRRFVYIKALKTEDFTDLDLSALIEAENYIGCGVDYIEYLTKHKEEIKATGWLKKFQKFDFTDNIEKAFNLLEKFYGCKFVRLREKIEAVLEEQYQEASENLYDIFVEKFRNFLVEKENNFIRKKLETSKEGLQIPIVLYSKGDNFGYIDFTQQKVYILTEKFKDFCEKNNLSHKSILALAKANGDLITRNPQDSRYRIVAHIPSPSGEANKASVYCFRLDGLLTKEELKETTEEEQLEEWSDDFDEGEIPW